MRDIVLPADYRMVENADGSATIIRVGETERGPGLRGVIGITLHPGKAYIETNMKKRWMAILDAKIIQLCCNESSPGFAKWTLRYRQVARGTVDCVIIT